MPAAIADLQARVTLDSSTAKKGLKEINDEVGKSPGFFQKAAGGVLGFVAGGALLAGVAGAASFVTGALGDMVGAAGESQQVMAQTEAGIKSTGGAAGMTAQSVSALATKISNLSGIDDEAVQTGENMLLTFTSIGKDVFPMATQAAADMATKMNGGVIPSAQQMQQQALLVGKALNDPIKGLSALSREGVTFSDSQKKAIAALVKTGDTAGAQKLMLAELSKEFGGAAAAAGDTFPGKLAKMQVAFGNIEETIGGAIIPILSNLFDSLSPIMQQIGDALPGALAGLQAVFAPVFSAIGDAVAQIGPIIGDIVADFSSMGKGAGGMSVLGDVFKMLGPVVKQVGDVFRTAILPVLKTLWENIQTNLLPAVHNIAQVILQNFLPAILKLWGAISPILIPVLNVLGWVLGNIIGPALVIIINILVGVINVVATVIGWFTNLGGTLSALGGFFGWLIGIIGDFHNKAIAKISAFISGAISFFANLPGQVWGIVTSFVVGVMIRIGTLELQLLAKVASIISGVVGFFAGLPGKALSAIGALKDTIIGFFANLGPTMLSMGSNLIQSLIDGIKNMAGALGSAFHSVVSNIQLPFGLHVPGFAEGGYVPGGLTAINERGGEIVALPGGSYVYPRGTGPGRGAEAAAALTGGRGSGGKGGNTYVVNARNGPTAREIVSHLQWMELVHG
jgi:phage-related protein